MTLREVGSFHRSMFVPSRMTVVASGDASHEALADLVERAFGGWTPASEAPGPADPVVTRRPSVPPDRVAFPRRGGAIELRIGHFAVARDTPDYHPAVLNVLGAVVSRATEPAGARLHVRARTSFDFRRARPVRAPCHSRSEVPWRYPRALSAARRPLRSPVTRKSSKPTRRADARLPPELRTSSRSARLRASRALLAARRLLLRSCRACWRSTSRTDSVSAEHIVRRSCRHLGTRQGPTRASAAESRHAAGSCARLTGRPTLAPLAGDEIPVSPGTRLRGASSN